MKITEVRLTIAAYVYSIENDLKIILKSYIVPSQSNFAFFSDTELVTRTKERFAKENIGLDAEKYIQDVVEYLDFGDIIKIVLKNKTLLPARIEEVIKKVAPAIEKIIPIRNRTMHTRPLLYGDFFTIHSFLVDIKQFYGDVFPSSVAVLEKIQSNPSYILTLDFPQIPDENNVVSHNLPMPDFDETGLIGRQKDVDELRNLILRNQVVTLIGAGGIGKSALMLKVAYDIVDMNKACPFDIIIWVSAKTTALTARGIEEIKDALSDYSKVIGKIAGHFEKQKYSVEDNIALIMDYVKTFKTLLIIDNLETIQNESINEFIRDAQMYCKIAITSRIGLGELEYRRVVNGLSGSDSAKMIRELALIRNSQEIGRLPQSALVEIAEKLYFNPLAIKWFVNSVVIGKSPNDVLARKEGLLDFCLTNVYDKLTGEGLRVLSVIRSARRPLSEAEIIFLSELPTLDCRRGIMDLLTTTFVSRDIQSNNTGQQVIYKISDFPNDYLLKNHAVEASVVRNIQKNISILNESVKNIKYKNEANEFNLTSIEVRSSEEKIASKLLTDALSLSRRGDYQGALNKLEDVKGIAPSYFEIYTISAFIKASNDDLLGADDDYKTSLELESEDVKTLYYYARFLMFILQDIDDAAQYVDKVFELRPDNPYTILLKANFLEGSSDFKGTVELLSDYIDNKAIKSSKEMRMAVSEITHAYHNWAQNLINYDQDYALAAEKLILSTVFYDKAFNVQNVDKKMSDKLAKTLSMMLSLPKLIAESHLDKLLHLHSKYSDHMALSEYYPGIVRRIFDMFDVKLNESYLSKDVNESRDKGIISQYYSNKNYVFIECNGEKVFAHKDNFKNILDWNEINNGLVVVFDKRPSAAPGKSPTAFNVEVALYEF